jgi:hypothetical protein
MSVTLDQPQGSVLLFRSLFESLYQLFVFLQLEIYISIDWVQHSKMKNVAKRKIK